MMRLYIKITLVVIVLSTSLFTSSAFATWGNGCTRLNHCYALAEWYMGGTGNGGGSEAEEVMGLETEIYTTSMLVPEWASGAFVTNEQWMVGPNNGWAEDGQVAGDDYWTEEGREVNGDSLHWFYAFSIGSPAVYTQYVAPWTYNGYEWIHYYEEDTERNGRWCARIHESGPVACDGYFKPYATRVEGGMEAGDEQQPENAGKDGTAVLSYITGKWYHWYKAEDETIDHMKHEESSDICVNKYVSIPGFIEWGTPTSKWPC